MGTLTSYRFWMVITSLANYLYAFDGYAASKPVMKSHNT